MDGGTVALLLCDDIIALGCRGASGVVQVF